MMYRFGAYEFDSVQLELREGATRKALTPALNRLLLLLVTHPGELVTREQIAAVLWDSQETVDVVAGINTAMRRLRTTIGDGIGHGVFIQTVVGAGYRFTAPVVVVTEQPDAEADALLSPPLTNSAAPRWRNRSIGIAGMLLLLGLSWWTYSTWKTAGTTELTGSPYSEQLHPLTFDDVDDKLTAEAISPSGKYLASADVHGITIQNLANAEKEVEVIEALKLSSIEHIAWSPDESSVLVSAYLHEEAQTPSGSARREVWVVPIGRATPRMLLDDAAMAVPSPDGRVLAFLRNGNTELWTSDVDGQNPRMLARTANSDTFTYLLWSPRGGRVITDRLPPEYANLAGADFISAGSPTSTKPVRSGHGVYESYDSHTGALLAHREDTIFKSAILLRDGLLIYPVSQQEEPTRLAMVKTDPTTGSFLASPTLLSFEQAFGFSGDRAQDVSISANGNTMAFILERKNVDVYTADLVGTAGPDPAIANEARLTTHSFGNYPTSWTPNSKAVIFDSGVNGPISINEQALVREEIHPLVRAKSSTAKFAQGRFSPDGQWLLFLKMVAASDKIAAIERVPAAGGEPQTVLSSPQIEGFRCSMAASGRCVLREIEGNKEFVYYELDPIRGMGRELARAPLVTHVMGDWAVSPDGNTIAVANHNPGRPSIQLIRLVDRQPNAADVSAVREISVPGYGVVLSPSWNRDGRGLFVETSATGEYDLLYLDLRGTIRLLRKSPGLIWAVPSPDGKKIAFPAETRVSRNVWSGSTRLGVRQ